MNINFSSELNIITGETGAGKSILVGALSLILGERADTSVLLNTNKKCFVEGIFSVDDNNEIQNFLKENELDESNELIVRREISSAGKSRAFINDTPATLQQLKQLASLLVDLHQQFDNLELGNTHFQREVVDALANNQSLLQSYQTQYRQWLQAKHELNNLQEQKIRFAKEYDYNKFLFDELKELNLKENELEDLDTELQLLNSSEEIKTTLTQIYFDLKESEQPVVQSVKQMVHQLQNYSSLHHSLPNVIERLQSCQVELNDIAAEINTINNSVNFDENKIQLINDRLSAGYKLLKKHNAQTTAQLLQLQEELQQKLKTVLDIDDAILEKEKQTRFILRQVEETAQTISINRKNQIQPLEKNVNTLLVQVGMPNASIKIKVEDIELNEFGKDEIRFLFDANKSNHYEPVHKVASGGELSRLMLCIKSLVAESMDLPTMIFDEIDTGISGEAAKQVGMIMKKLATQRQVVCITHQPQIAAKATAHYFVFKEPVDGNIKTKIKLLNHNERITAIAQMLSGEQPTNAALQNAKEMLG
jgi:DNA repair protein RecN (Recombination protein N)